MYKILLNFVGFHHVLGESNQVEKRSRQNNFMVNREAELTESSTFVKCQRKYYTKHVKHKYSNNDVIAVDKCIF